MRPLDNGVAMPAGYTITLKPRGYHLLLLGVKAPLAKGSTVPVTLTFEKAGAVTVEFAVEEPGLIGEAILNEEHHTRIAVPSAEGVLDQQRIGVVAEIARPDRHLAVAARHVEHIGRLRQPAQPAAQRLHQGLAALDRNPEMPGAAHQVGMVQVVGLYARAHQGAHQRVQGLDVVVDAGQQHRLAHQRNAGVGQPRQGRARARARARGRDCNARRTTAPRGAASALPPARR